VSKCAILYVLSKWGSWESALSLEAAAAEKAPPLNIIDGFSRTSRHVSSADKSNLARDAPLFGGV